LHSAKIMIADFVAGQQTSSIGLQLRALARRSLLN
jgi:hypothetical protein